MPDPLGGPSLYVGTGSGLFRRAGELEEWAAVEGLPAVEVRALIEGPEPGSLVVATVAGVFQSPDGGFGWQAASAGLIDRDVLTLARVAVGQQIAFAGTAAGLFASRTGVSWSRADHGLDANSITTLDAVPGSVWAGTASAGVVFTDSVTGDAARGTWQERRRGLPSGPVRAIVVAEGAGQGSVVLAAAGGSGVFRCRQPCTEWIPVGIGLPRGPVLDLVVDPRTSRGLIYAVVAASGIFCSDDQGSSWFAVNAGISDLRVRTLALGPRDGDDLWAGTQSGRVFLTTNPVGGWAEPGAGVPGLVTALATDPLHADTLFAGTAVAGVFRSRDRGRSWQSTSVGLDSLEVRALAIAGGERLFVATAAGVYEATDGADRWRRRNRGLASPDVLALTADLSTGTLWAGTNGRGASLAVLLEARPLVPRPR